MLLVCACGKNEASTPTAPANTQSGTAKSPTEGNPSAGAPRALETLTVAQLTRDLASHEGKSLRLRGLVSHVCRRSGKKLFLVGVEEGQNLKVVPGDGSTTYDVSLEGTEVIVQGKLVSTVPKSAQQDHDRGADDSCAMKQLRGYALESVSLTPAK
jgi:hypothetical protein